MSVGSLAILLALGVVGPAAEADQATGAPTRRINTLSLDHATIWQDAPHQTTRLTIVSASREMSDRVSLFCKLGLVQDRSAIGAAAWGVSNPVLGATLQVLFGDRLQLVIVLGSTVPLGSGGGDAPGRPGALRAMLNGTDWGGPMFGPNHLDLFEGFRFATSAGPLTLRARSTLHPVRRVRGKRTDTLGRWVIFTSSGVSAAYSLPRTATLFGELAETRFLNRPAFLGPDPAARSDHYAILGLALDFALGAGPRLQPTLSLGRAVDAPKNARAFRLAEVGLQLSF